jgi:hypothetical protein
VEEGNSQCKPLRLPGKGRAGKGTAWHRSQSTWAHQGSLHTGVPFGVSHVVKLLAAPQAEIGQAPSQDFLKEVQQEWALLGQRSQSTPSHPGPLQVQEPKMLKRCKMLKRNESCLAIPFRKCESYPTLGVCLQQQPYAACVGSCCPLMQVMVRSCKAHHGAPHQGRSPHSPWVWPPHEI